MSHKSAPAGGRGAIAGAIKAFAQQRIPVKLVGSFLHANKLDGFDCPGCAFPDKPGAPMVDSCEQGQKAIAWEMTRKQTGVDFFAGKTPAQLQQLSDHELEAHGRLTTPILYEKQTGVFRAISWADAYVVIGREMAAFTPAQAAFYASGRSSNEAAFLWQLMARSYGCANLPDSSNFCHEPSGFALKQALGTGKGTCALTDFEHAELIIVMGQNPASNHPRMMVALYEAAQRGATVLAFNPLKERGFDNFSDPKNVGELLRNDGVAVASAIHQVQLGGDLAALKGIIKALLELASTDPQVLDHEFIAQHTDGFAALCEDVANESWLVLCAASGLTEAALRDVAKRYALSNATMITWCMGITHHEHAVATIQHIVNLLLLRGNIGKPGAGALPVRGHSNVQGDRTMGATSSVSVQFLDNLEAAFPDAKLCREAGLNAAAVINGLLAGEIRALLSLGGNFGVAAPDSPRVLAALEKCRLTVHIATKLNRTHCHPGEIGLLLPTLGRTDIDTRQGAVQFVTTEDSMSVVRRSRGVQAPIDDAMQISEPAIVANIGAQLAPHARSIPWLELANDYARIREFIEQGQRGVTAGFEQFNQRITSDGRVQLPNRAAQRRFVTASGKAEFRVHPLPKENAVQLARQRHGDSVLALMTLRSHDQFNTTVYTNNDRYRGVFGDRRVLLIHADDLNRRGLFPGDQVDIEAVSNDGIVRRVSRFTTVAYDIPRGCVAAYFPEASALLAAGIHSTQTQTPAYKDVPVLLYRSR
ncbi:FdhF/YdeP family oxidoreductase [Permianibacter sp. IMCC34836]|uniref:FdhF/YdeP family oxidoreductase n=1 Tax=Permianibacter fluminis TaxID=2738515 RepID=UPI001555412D|nr:FdhF/YdeP family oxidoreductase [Permianibacter fluminis]NQD36753.1 FdhF/YdeP family oxidoreductase [Permianibacter fluminis]